MKKIFCDMCGREAIPPAPEGYRFIWDKTPMNNPSNKIVLKLSMQRDFLGGESPDLCTACFSEGVKNTLLFWSNQNKQQK